MSLLYYVHIHLLVCILKMESNIVAVVSVNCC